MNEVIANIPETIRLSLMIIGGLAILVRGLKETVPPLREWSAATANKTDDRIVAVFAKGVGLAAKVLGVLEAVLSPFAMQRQGK